MVICYITVGKQVLKKVNHRTKWTSFIGKTVTLSEGNLGLDLHHSDRYTFEGAVHAVVTCPCHFQTQCEDRALVTLRTDVSAVVKTT